MLWNYISFVAGAFCGIMCLTVMLMFKLKNEHAASQPVEQTEKATIVVHESHKALA